MPDHQNASQAAQAHLTIMQGVIHRMAGNSAACKAWCIALVSAVLVLVADKNDADYAWLALIPSVLFLVLDAYYLALEKAFRQAYNDFIGKLHTGTAQASDFFVVEPAGSRVRQFFGALGSFSVWPLYGTLIVMIYLARRFVL